MLVKVIKKSRNVQVTRSLLELRGGHVVVFQVKVPQVVLMICGELHLLLFLLPKTEAFSARSRESPDTFCSSVAVGSCHTGGPFLLRTGTAGEGLGRTKGARSPSSIAV